MTEIGYTKTCWSCSGTGATASVEEGIAVHGVTLREARPAGSECLECRGTGRIDKDRAELASEQGFTGTLDELLAWLEASLVYGGIQTEEIQDSFGRDVLQVKLVTGGFSSDEHLLSRVSHSPYMSVAWRSTHAGGLYVYEFTESWCKSQEPLQWLAPEADHPFEVLGRVTQVTVHGADGAVGLYGGLQGVELVFSEPDRDINNAAGELIIRPWTGSVG